MPRLGTFEAYRLVMGGTLEAAGLPGFLTNRDELRLHADPDTQRWRDFVERWANQFGSELVETTDLEPLAIEAGFKFKPGKSGKITTARGTRLGGKRQSVFGVWRIEKQGRQWSLSAASPKTDTLDTLDTYNGSYAHSNGVNALAYSATTPVLGNPFDRLTMLVEATACNGDAVDAAAGTIIRQDEGVVGSTYMTRVV